MLNKRQHYRLSIADFVYAIEMGIASLLSYWIITVVLSPFVGKHEDMLGGMWAVISTVFVFRHTRTQSLAAAVSRSLATIVSVLLCVAYLSVLPFTPLGLAVVLICGVLITLALGRREEVFTTSITTTVVMVVAAVSSEPGWRQPVLRLIDTLVGVGVGIAFRWLTFALLTPWRPDPDGHSSIQAGRRTDGARSSEGGLDGSVPTPGAGR
jgi:uncharacterized membrane protein YccC